MSKLSWYNFVKEEYEYRDEPTTDAEARELISQHPSALGLYACYRAQNYSILDAMVEVSKVCAGVESEVNDE